MWKSEWNPSVLRAIVITSEKSVLDVVSATSAASLARWVHSLAIERTLWPTLPDAKRWSEVMPCPYYYERSYSRYRIEFDVGAERLLIVLCHWCAVTGNQWYTLLPTENLSRISRVLLAPLALSLSRWALILWASAVLLLLRIPF